MNIIDFHAHSVLDEKFFSVTHHIMRLAKRCGIKHICLLGDVLRFGHNPPEKQVQAINDQTISLVKKWPDFFYGFCFLNPLHPERFLREQVYRCLAHKNFKGIKLEVAVNAADKKVDKVMKIAEKRGLIVLHHSWNTTIINNRQHQSDPEDIACLACRFPNVKIVMAHITSATERGVLAIQPLKNVWVDTSGGQPVADTIEYAVEKLGPERILFGSDIPGRDFSAQLGKIYGCHISKHEKEMILYKNAERLLGLS